MNLALPDRKLDDIIFTLQILYRQHGRPLLSALDLLLSHYGPQNMHSSSGLSELEIVPTLDSTSRTVFEYGKDKVVICY
jgi:hypothetical protein